MSQESDIKEENKQKFKFLPGMRKFFDLTLRELHKLGYPFRKFIKFENFELNLDWVELVRLVNYCAKQKVLTLDDTFRYAMEEIMPSFLG